MPAKCSKVQAALIAQMTKSGVGFRASPEDVVWGVIDGTAAIIDGVVGLPLASATSNAIQAYANEYKAVLKPEDIPNPWMVLNGIVDADSPGSEMTAQYLRKRNLLNAGGNLIAASGALLSTLTQADVGGIIQHGNALISTSVHMVKLKAIADRYKQSATISAWLDMIQRLKRIKAGVRGVQLAGSVIPVPFVGLATSLGATLAKLGVKLTMTKAVLMTAAELHWRAYQEWVISRGHGTGPATVILDELFTRRGATRVFGKHDIRKMIQEPAGWMAVSDKVGLI